MNFYKAFTVFSFLSISFFCCDLLQASALPEEKALEEIQKILDKKQSLQGDKQCHFLSTRAALLQEAQALKTVIIAFQKDLQSFEDK